MLFIQFVVAFLDVVGAWPRRLLDIDEVCFYEAFLVYKLFYFGVVRVKNWFMIVGRTKRAQSHVGRRFLLEDFSAYVVVPA